MMQKTRVMQILAGVIVAFSFLVGLIIYLARARVITIEMAILMLVALFGIYVGFGILIFAYRFINRLD